MLHTLFPMEIWLIVGMKIDPNKLIIDLVIEIELS